MHSREYLHQDFKLFLPGRGKKGCAKITVFLQKFLFKQHPFLPTLSLK